MAISVVSFSFSWCSTGGSGAHSAGFLYLILSPTGMVPKLHRGSRGAPMLGGGFPYHTRLHLIWSPTHWLPVLTELYNSSIAHSVAHSIFGMACLSGNNCYAVQRSLSSGTPVYECIMGFYLVPFRQPNPLTRFLSITSHWNVSLPSGASLWNGMFGRVKGRYTTSGKKLHV